MSDYEFDISTSKTREQLAELYRAKSRQVGRLSDENERLRAALKKIEAAWQDEVMDGQSSPLLDVIEAALREMSDKRYREGEDKWVTGSTRRFQRQDT